jgi:asparagine synthase (glutamine-hydrolysing)
MCGITGFIDFKKESTAEVLTAVTDTFYHRGPDGSGVELLELDKASVGLGHRRLSIIDLTSFGKQPMQFENYWICFNGEVYNYAEIKKELTELGHAFSGNSDTEVILHAFAQWGKECVHWNVCICNSRHSISRSHLHKRSSGNQAFFLLL